MTTLALQSRPHRRYTTAHMGENLPTVSQAPGPARGHRYSLSFPTTTETAPRDAREFVRTRLASQGIDADTAELAVSELVTNVARHAPGESSINLTIRAAMIVLSVADTHPETPIDRHGHADDDALSGRGLDILAAISLGMTVRRLPHSKRVTVRLPIGGES